MNVARGFKRIIWVLAIIAIVPGSIRGWEIRYKDTRTINVGYTQEEREAITRSPPQGLPEGYIPVSRPVQVHPSAWRCAINATVYAVGWFLIVLLGLRFVLWVSLWVVAGFRNETKG